MVSNGECENEELQSTIPGQQFLSAAVEKYSEKRFLFTYNEI